MADIQSNIKVNIDTSNALEQIKLLQSQISAFHTQMAKSGAQASAQSAQLRQNLVNGINATGKFSAQMTTVKTSTEYFTQALEKNKLTMGEYFRYAGGASKTFGKLFKSEFETIGKVARERVKDLQTQYIKMGRDASGAMQAIKVRPLALDMQNLSTKTAIAAQKQQLLNQLLKQGSTNLLNFGKNTQWAGRQLMVGFTVPLVMFGSAAMKSFNEMERAVVKFKRVYGDMNTMTSDTNKMVGEIRKLAESYTQYGIAIKDTMDMAATAAATGKMGSDLMAQVASATKLAVLGGVDQEKALQTTISLTNAFGLSADELAKKIDFLNAVENQTVLSIDDLTTAIPKAAPVVKQLGGSVEDLAFFLTAMKEGGINASEGANALKSGLAALINPTNTASKMLAGFGINIKGIVEGDKGNLKKTVVDFATALNQLDPLNRAKAIEQLFGKFQFARLSTLFKNVTDQGSQAARALELTKASAEELAIVSQREMSKISESPTFKFEKAMKDFQASMMPIGEQFLKAATPILNFFGDILKRFDGLDNGTKGFITNITGIVAGIGPVVLMVVGLVANGIANIIKLFANFKSFFNNLGKGSKDLASSTKYMTSEQIEAASVAASLDQVHGKLTQTFTSEAAAIQRLVAEYQKAIAAQAMFRGISTPAGTVPKAYATGGKIIGPGTGTSDSILARVSNGEAIIPASSVSRYPGLINQLVSGNVPGFEDGIPKITSSIRPDTVRSYTEFVAGLSGKTNTDLMNNVANRQDVIGQFRNNPVAIQGPLIASVAEQLAGATSQKQIDTFLRNNPHVITYAGNLSNNIAQELSMLTTEKMGDTHLTSAVQKAIAKTPASAELKGAIQRMSTVPTTFEDDSRLRQRSDGRLMAIGRERLTNESGRYTSTFNRGMALSGRLVPGHTLVDPVAAHLTAPMNMSMAETRAAVIASGRTMHPFAESAFDRKERRVALLAGQEVPIGQTGALEANARAIARAKKKALAAQDGTEDANIYNKAKDAALAQEKNDSVHQSRSKLRNSPHPQSGIDGKDDGIAYNAAKTETLLELGATEQEILRAQTESFIALSSEGGAAEGAAHTEARVAAARTENAEVLAVYKEGQAAELAAMEQQSAMLMSSGGAGGYIGRRATIIAEREAAGQAKAAQKLANKEERQSRRAVQKEINQTKYGKFQKVGMAAMMPAMMGSMAGGQIGEMSQQLMMPMMMMSMITGPVTAVIAALGLLAFAAFKLKEGYDQQIKKTLELVEAMGTSNKAMENFASFAKKATPTSIMDMRRQNQYSLFQNATGKTTYGESFIKSEEGKKMLDSVGTGLAQNGTALTSSQISTQLGAAVVNGIFTKAQALSIADNIGRQLNDYNLSMNVNAKLNELLGPDGKDITKQPLEIKVKARMEMIKDTTKQTSEQLSAVNSAYKTDFEGVMNQSRDRNSVLGSEWMILINPIPRLYTIITTELDNAAKKSANYVGLVSNNIQNIQQQMDGFSIDLDNALADARNNNDEKRIKTLLTLQKETMNTLNDRMKAQYQLLIDSMNNGDVSFGDLNNASNTAIDNAYKGTAQEPQASTVKTLVENVDLSNANELAIKLAIANKSLDLSATQQYFNTFGNNSTMLARLGVTTQKFGGTLASQMASATGDMSASTAAHFTSGVAKSKTYEDANNLVSGMLSARQAAPVGGPNAIKHIEDFYGSHLGELKKFNSELTELKNTKTITLPIIAKIYGAKEVAAMTKDAKYFNSLNKNNRIIYTQTFDTYFNMKADPEFIADWKVWQKGNGSEETDKTKEGYARWLARQATEQAKMNDALNGGANDGGKDTPQASFLDDIVKGIRDTINWRQKLTTGWTASKKAIEDFFKAGKTGFNGLMEKLTGQRVQDTLMKQMLGLSKEDYEAHKAELVDQYGKLTKFGQQIQRANQLVTIGNYIGNQQISVAESARIIDSFQKLKKAGIDVAMATELMKDKDFALAVAGAKVSEINTIVTNTLKARKAAYDALSDSEKDQKGISLWQAGLDVISDKETKINKAYDDRIKALDEVSKINSEISAAQQDQMDIAEALSRGDIFAAAKAQKNMISNDAQRAVENAKGMLNSQREQEINSIQIDINGNLRDRLWLTEKIADATSRIHTDTLAQLSEDMVVYLTGKLPKPINKATGGHIVGAGSGTSDSIPAMLSNGEYVIRANAVKTIGVNTLDKLNQADRTNFSSGGMAIPRFATGGYIGPRPEPQWDTKGRWVVSHGESYWSTAENTLPGGMDVGPWWSRILKSNIDPETGKERRLYRNSRIWIPGSQEPYPPKSGIPRIFPEKPLYVGGGEPISVHENHMYGGNGGSNGLGTLTKLFANGGMVGYKDGGKAEDTAMSNRWMAMGKFFANNKAKETRKRLTNSEMINMAATDPKAPWNNGNWATNGNDPKQRKLYWQQYGWRPSWTKEGDPTSGEVTDVAKNMSYFVPVIGAGSLYGDAITAAQSGDYVGAGVDTAFATGSLWMPAVGRALAASPIGQGIKTGLRTGVNWLGKNIPSAFNFIAKGIGNAGKGISSFGSSMAEKAKIFVKYKVPGTMWKMRRGMEDVINKKVKPIPKMIGEQVSKVTNPINDFFSQFLPSPKGIGVEKTSGPKALGNPNLSLFLKNLFGKNYHGGRNTVIVNGKVKTLPFNIGRRPEMDPMMDPESYNQNWFGAEFFSTVSKKLAATYGPSIFKVRMPFLSPFKMKILDLYPGAKSVAEQYPELYAKYPHLFGSQEGPGSTNIFGDIEKYPREAFLRPDRHVTLAQQLANVPSWQAVLKEEFGIDVIRHQSGHGAQKKLPGAGFFSEVFAYLNPAKGMKATTMPLLDTINNQKRLYSAFGSKDAYLRYAKRTFFTEPIVQPIQKGLHNIGKLFKPKMVKDEWGDISFVETPLSKLFDSTKNLLNPVGNIFKQVPNIFKDIIKKFGGVKNNKSDSLGRNNFEPISDSALNPGGVEHGIWMKNKRNNADTYIKHYGQQEKSFIEPFVSFLASKLGSSTARYSLVAGENFMQNKFTSGASSVLGVMERVPKDLLVASEKISNAVPIENAQIQEWLLKTNVSPNDRVRQLIENLKEFASHTALLNSVIGNTDVHTGNILMDATTGKFHSLDYGHARLQQLSPMPLNSLNSPDSPGTAGSLNAAMRTMESIKNAFVYNIGKVFPNGQIDASLIKELQSNLIPANTSDFMERLKNLSETDYMSQFVKEKIGNNPAMLSEFKDWIKKTIPKAQKGFSHFGTLGNDPNFLKSMYENIKQNIDSVGGVFHFARGGFVPKHFVNGGYSQGTDTVPAMLSPGEYVFQKSAVDRIGLNNLNAMNQGDTIGGDSVYNYSINVNVKSDANASQIADTVLRQIKQIDSQRLRSVRI